MKRHILLPLFVVIAILAGCTKEDPEQKEGRQQQEEQEQQVEPVAKQVPRTIASVADLSLHEKVCQMIFLRPEALDPAGVSKMNLTEAMKQTFAEYPVGGFTLFAANIFSPFQCVPFTDDLHDLANYPLLSVDEEGGTVARIAKNAAFSVTNIGSAYDIGATGDNTKAFGAGGYVGEYLLKYGFDIDLAPVADVWTNPENKVIGKRAFSSDPQQAARMSSQFLLGLRDQHVEGCLKHFPGHGDTETDSHYGFATTYKTWEELLECEMIPFKEGIKNGVKMIMTAHVETPNVTGDSTPATLSRMMLTDILRGELGFKGVIVTDAFEMQAITDYYSVTEAALMAVKAGVDVILVPGSFKTIISAIEKAVEEGEISEERITESAERILDLKRSILESRGLLKK